MSHPLSFSTSPFHFSAQLPFLLRAARLPSPRSIQCSKHASFEPSQIDKCAAFMSRGLCCYPLQARSRNRRFERSKRQLWRSCFFDGHGGFQATNARRAFLFAHLLLPPTPRSQPLLADEYYKQCRTWETISSICPRNMRDGAPYRSTAKCE